MIDFKLYVKNPFHKNNDFKSLYEKGGKLFGDKCWEVQFMRYSWNLLEVEVDTNMKGRDHAGLSLSIGFLGFIASFKIYDTRHWNHDKNDWEQYD